MTKQRSNQFITWAMLLMLPLWLSNCSKGGGDSVTPNSIEGTWTISGFAINPGVDFLQNGQKTTDLLAFFKSLPNGAGTDVVTCLTTTTISFNSGGKVTSKAGQKCDAASVDPSTIEDNSTWKLDGTKLTITDNTGTQTFDVNRNGNTMGLSTTGTEDYGEGNKTYTTTIQLTR